jgi:tetratricopeptide (TPR) repeat protein
VQKAGVDLRVRARLIRAATHEQVWHGEYNRPYSALFALQDEIANQILEGVHRRMVQLVSRRQGPEHPSDLDSWELVARASHLADAGTPSGNALAREHLQIAVSKDPYLSSGWYLLAQTYQQDLVHQWAQAPRDTLQRLIEVSAAFERHHAGNAGARLIAAYVELYRGQREAAAERVRAALEAGPNLARAYSVYGQVLAMGNEPDAALEQLEMSLRLSPRDTERWAAHAASALAHFVAERHAEAAMHAEEAVSRAPELPFTQAIVASLNVWAGNLERARRALTALEALHPSMSVSGFGVINSSTDPDIARRFLDGLRRAGLPH